MTEGNFTQPVAVFDLDGTLFRWQLYHELVFELKSRGMFDETACEKLDESYHNWKAKRQSFNNYEQVVIATLTQNLTRIDPNDLETAAERIVKRSGHKVYSYTKQLLEALQSRGYFTLAISGSQHEIVGYFADIYGFDEYMGSSYEQKDGAYTGEHTRYVPDSKGKLLTEFIDARPELTLKDSYGIGDSGSDISMLELVEHPIAFNPSVELFEHATNAGWQIVIERKNIAYTLEKGSNGQYILEKTKKLF